LSIKDKIAALRQHHANLTSVIYNIKDQRMSFQFGPGFSGDSYRIYHLEDFEPRSETAKLIHSIENEFNGRSEDDLHFGE